NRPLSGHDGCGIGKSRSRHNTARLRKSFLNLALFDRLLRKGVYDEDTAGRSHRAGAALSELQTRSTRPTSTCTKPLENKRAALSYRRATRGLTNVAKSSFVEAELFSIHCRSEGTYAEKVIHRSLSPDRLFRFSSNAC